MNWTTQHSINLALFVCTLLLTGLGTVATWQDIPHAINPTNVAGFGLSVLTFLKTMYTPPPRDTSIGTRASDPNPTAPIVQTGPNTAVAVPPVNPGRPTEPPKE